MKKLACVSLILILCLFIFVGCSDKKTNTNESNDETEIVDTQYNTPNLPVTGENDQTMNKGGEEDDGELELPTPTVAPENDEVVPPTPTPVVENNPQENEIVVTPTPTIGENGTENEDNNYQDQGYGENDPNDLGMF